MVWGGLRLIMMIFLRLIIIVRYRGCGMWLLTAFWGTLFQLAVSPFNWIDIVMEDVARRVGKMLDNKAGREPNGEENEVHNLKDLWKKYPWLLNERESREPATSPEKAEAGDAAPLFEGRITWV
jgi:hypothetical protein